MTRREYLSGGYTPTEAHYSIRDRLWQPASRTRLVLVLHGAGGAAIDAAPNANFPALSGLFGFLARQAVVVFTPDAGGTLTFGNDASVAAAKAAVDYAHARFGTVDVTVIGVSMGFAVGVNLADQHPSYVDRLIGITPLCDLSDAVDNNRGGHAASINAAYGGSYASNGTGHNPVTIAPDLTVPLQVWYGDADTTCPPATVEAFAAAWGGTVDSHEIAGGGHGNTTYDAVDRYEVAGFLQ